MPTYVMCDDDHPFNESTIYGGGRNWDIFFFKVAGECILGEFLRERHIFILHRSKNENVARVEMEFLFMKTR